MRKNFEHTADIGIEVETSTISRAFEEAALGFSEIITGGNLPKELISNDVSIESDNLDSLLEGVDFCFHLAAGVGVQYIMENVSKALLTNIEGTHKVIESCKNKNVPILITSTSEVYGVSEDLVWTEESILRRIDARQMTIGLLTRVSRQITWLRAMTI